MAPVSVPRRSPPTKVGHTESDSYKEDWAELEAAKELFLDRSIAANYRSTTSKKMLEDVLAKSDLHVFHRAWAHGLLATVHVLLCSAANFRLAKHHAEMSIAFYQELAESKIFNSKVSAIFVEQAKMYYITLMMSAGKTFSNVGQRTGGVKADDDGTEIVKFLDVSLEYDTGSEVEMEDYENTADAGA